MTRKRRAFAAGALFVSLLLVAFVAPFASHAPDGLERFARERGFASRAAESDPGYAVKGVANPRLGTALAGIAGTLAVFGVALGTAALLSRKRAEGR